MRHLILSLTTLLLTTFTTPIFAQGPGCPSIDAGPDQTLACGVSCTNLSANVFQILGTTSYTVGSLPYSGLPYATNMGVQLNIDDRWSNVINLPFTFCFFGASYTSLVVSSNGVICFNTGYANSYHEWSFGTGSQVPANNAAFRPNSIYGAMHDMDPSIGGQIRYGIQGSYPCRAFVFTFENVPHYNCHSKKTTQQIVLYEGTNAIEVYIQNKPVCGGWNGGNAVIGIENAAGDVGYAPPGRNTGNWSASNEAWRFTPAGAPAYQITWYENNINTPPLGTGANIQVCPSNQFTTYSALLTYTNCANQSAQFWDAVQVQLTGPAQPDFTSNSPICETQTLQFNAPTVAGATYVWSGPNGWSSSAEDPSIANATSAISGTYNLYIVVAGCTSSTASQQITVVSAATMPTFTTNSPVCQGTSIELNGPPLPGATYVWSGPNGFTASSEDPTVGSATAANSGTYNLYVVVAGCTSATASQNVVVNPAPAQPNFTTNSPLCTGNNITFDGPTVAGATYAWTGPGGWTASTEDPTRPNASLGMAGDYYLTITVNGCSSTVAMQNVVVNGPDIPIFEVNSPVCSGDSIIFSANSIPGATYVWSGPNGWSSSTEDPFIANATASLSGDYSLYLVSNGCTSITAMTPVFVNPIVAPNFSTNSPICAGSNLVFTGPVDSISTYIWSGPLSWTDSIASPTIAPATPAMSGNYSLYMITLGCTTAVATQPVTINPIPAAPAVSSNSPVCEGAALTLNGPTIAGATYSWTGPNSYTSSNEDNTLTPSTLGMSGTYQLTTTVAGCTSAPGSVTVTVNDVAALIPNVTPLTPCQGSSVAFAVGVTLQAPSTVIAQGWDVDGNGVPDYNTASANHIYTAAGSYNATFGLISTGNCTSTVVVPIVVNPKPVVTYTGPGDQCGTSVNLTSNGQVAAPGSIAGYQWFLTGGTSIGMGQNLPHNFTANPFQQVTGYVIATTGDGCSDSASFSINLQPSPLAGFTFSECIGFSVPFNNTTTWIGTPAPGATLSYNWLFGDSQTGNTANPTHVYNTPGTYTVTLEAVSSAFGCKDSMTAQVNVSEPPTVQITADAQCFQNVAFMGAINSHGSAIDQLNWDLGDGHTASDSAFVHEYQDAGTYTVTVTVLNAENCSTTASVPVVVLPSPTLSEIDIPNVITPNGDNMNDEIVLDTQFENCQEYEMHIFNRWGVEVFKQMKGSTPFRGYYQDGKKMLSTGVYFFTIKSGELQRNGTISITY